MSELSIPAAARLDDSSSRTVAAVGTGARLEASPLQVWNALVFYEELATRPPLHLRLLLPVPVGTSGSISDAGDEVTCIYEEGVIHKRATRVVPPNLYEFEVIQQTLPLGGGIELLGGRYTLRKLAGGATEVWVETHYRSCRAPRLLRAPIERFVFQSFHRFLLRSLCRRVEAT